MYGRGMGRRVPATLLAALALALLWTTSPRAIAGGAMVIRNGGGCLLDAYLNVVCTQNTHQVVLPDGTVLFSLRADGVANNTGRAVRWNAANSGMVYVFGTRVTTDWHETISANGNATTFIRFPPE